MEDTGRDPSAYYLANKLRIDTLVQDALEVMDNSRDAFVADYHRDASGGYSVVVGFTPEVLDAFFTQSYGVDVTDIPDEVLDQARALAEDTLTQLAQKVVEYVLTRAKDAYEDQHATDEDFTPQSFTFEHGTVKLVFKTDDSGRSIIFRSAELTGMNEFGTGTLTEIEVADSLVKEKVIVSKLGDTTPFIGYRIRPLQDDLMRMSEALFSKEDMAVLMDLMLGMFDTEADLDQAMAELANVYKDDIDSRMLTNVIGQIRTRALNAKTSDELSGADANKPPTYKLDEFKQIIAHLSS